MSEKIIDEAIFDLGIDGIEPRKKSAGIPAIISIAGMALLILAFIKPLIGNSNLKSGLALCGILLLIVGVIRLFTTLGGKGKPYYKPTSEFLKKYEVNCDISQKENMRRAILEGNFEALADIPSGQTSAVKAVVYKTQGNELAVAQMLEYVPHAYRAATDVKVFRKGEFIRSAEMA